MPTLSTTQSGVLVNHAPVQRGCNRIAALLVHTTRYAFEGQARLAHDVGVSRSTICRLMGGATNPTYRLVHGVTSALEAALHKPLDSREIFSPNGTYPTPSACALCGCAGCTPEEAYDGKGRLRPEWKNRTPGDWSLYPSSQPSRQLLSFSSHESAMVP